MWTMYATIQLGRDRPLVCVSDETGREAHVAWYLPDMLVWLESHGVPEVAVRAENGFDVFVIDRRGVKRASDGPPAGRVEPFDARGERGVYNSLDRRPPFPAARPENWPATPEGRRRKRLSSRWRAAGA